MERHATTEGFERLFEEHRDAVTRYVVRRIGRDGAADLVADTFAVALRQPTLPREPLPWLYAVARNLISNETRRRRRADATLGGPDTAEPEPPVGDFAGGLLDRLAMLAALRSLDPRDREVLCLLAWEGLAAREAATVLGCSTAAFRVRVHRARRRFATALTAHDDATHLEPIVPAPAAVETEGRLL